MAKDGYVFDRRLLDASTWTLEEGARAVAEGWAEQLVVRLEDGTEELVWVVFRHPGHNGIAKLP